MEPSVAPAGGPSRNLNWTPAILGSLVATALSSILLAFGATVGLRHFVCRTDVAGRFRRAVDSVRSISHHPGSTELWGGRIHCRSHAGSVWLHRMPPRSNIATACMGWLLGRSRSF